MSIKLGNTKIKLPDISKGYLGDTLVYKADSGGGYTYNDFLNFTTQTRDNVSTGSWNQNAAAFYLLRQAEIENTISSKGFSVNDYSNYIVRVSYTDSAGIRYYYYEYYFYNYSASASIAINSGALNIRGIEGFLIKYRVRGGYNGQYQLWGNNIAYSGNILSSGFDRSGYYGLQTLPVENYYTWRLENQYIR